VSTVQKSWAAAAAEPVAPELLARVAAAAAAAPSVRDTRPWWFSAGDCEIIFHADAGRLPAANGCGGRELLMSCGAALFNVRLALRNLGHVPQVAVLPDRPRTGVVARVSWGERAPATRYEERLLAEIGRGRALCGSSRPAPLPPGLFACLRAEAAREGAMLRIAAGGQRAALADAAAAAEHAARLDSARAQELAGGGQQPGAFARHRGWGLPASMMAPLHLSGGVVALLATSVDQPVDWICAGQALQRVLLAAGGHGIAAALYAQPLEIPELRAFIGIRLSDRAHPQMLLQLGAISGGGTVSVPRQG
jgi:hypothetical protein